MKETTQFTFRIHDYTPDTLPFERAIQYYQNLANMLGESQNMHLIDIFEGSCGSTLRVDARAIKSFERRVHELRTESAPPQAMSARANIGVMLAEDKTTASFEDELGNNVIEFPNAKTEIARPIKIRDTAAFVGELYHIAGTKADAKIRLHTDDYGVVFCSTTKSIAKEMRDYLFDDIKVSGRGQWIKNSDTGLWDIGAFVVTDFSPVVKESLKTAVRRVRSLNIDWPEDPLGKLAAINNDNDAA
jgi:hypothetical protein